MVPLIQDWSRRAAFTLLVGALLPGCSSPPADQIELMPAPDVYGNGMQKNENP